MVFEKARENGWKAIIPVYSNYVIHKIAGVPEIFWYTLASSVLFIVLFVFFGYSSSFIFFYLTLFVWCVFLLVMKYLFSKALAKKFGQSTAFAWGLFLLYPIFICILAFDKNIKYVQTEEIVDVDSQDDIEHDDFKKEKEYYSFEVDEDWDSK